MTIFGELYKCKKDDIEKCMSFRECRKNVILVDEQLSKYTVLFRISAPALIQGNTVYTIKSRINTSCHMCEIIEYSGVRRVSVLGGERSAEDAPFGV